MQSATRDRRPDGKLVVGMEPMPGASLGSDIDTIDQYEVHKSGRQLEPIDDALHGSSLRYIHDQFVARAPVAISLGRKAIAQHGEQFEIDAH